MKSTLSAVWCALAVLAAGTSPAATSPRLFVNEDAWVFFSFHHDLSPSLPPARTLPACLNHDVKVPVTVASLPHGGETVEIVIAIQKDDAPAPPVQINGRPALEKSVRSARRSSCAGLRSRSAEGFRVS